MKTAISIPDPLFERAESFARSRRLSRSQVFSDALREYLDRHDPDSVTRAMDRVCEETDTGLAPELREAARRALEQGEW